MAFYGCNRSGKTRSGINHLIFQVLTNDPTHGALCVDQKGLYYQTLKTMMGVVGRDHDLILLKIPPAGEEPEHTVNLTGNPDVPANTYAKALVDTAQVLMPERGFFPEAARDVIALCIEILRLLDFPTTIPNIYKIALNATDRYEILEKIEVFPTGKGKDLYNAYKNFIETNPEQRQGIEGTIRNFLSPFLTEEIAQVFCNPTPSMDISVIDQGKWICFALPQKFQIERMYINTLFKLNFYMHGLSRFDKSREELDRCNLITLFADEGQEVLTAAESAFADHRSAAVIREAWCTIVLATQAYSSILAALDKKFADVLMMNLTNELIFTQANQASAEIASKNIGERKVREKATSYSGGRVSNTYRDVIKPYFEPYELRKLPKYTAIIRHCEQRFKKALLVPLGDDGKVASWYRKN